MQATVNKFIAGGLAGASSSLMVHPLDFCQTRIVADIGTGKKERSAYDIDSQKFKI